MSPLDSSWITAGKEKANRADGSKVFQDSPVAFVITDDGAPVPDDRIRVLALLPDNVTYDPVKYVALLEEAA